VALVIAHTCKFRPARIPMRGGGIVSDKESPSSPISNVEKRVADDLGQCTGESRGESKRVEARASTLVRASESV